MNACKLHECLFMRKGLCFCACVYVCVYIHYSPPCILGKLPWAKRKAENKVTGAQNGGRRDTPGTPKSGHPSPPPRSNSPSTLTRYNDRLPPHPHPLCPTLFPSERSGAEREANPLEDREMEERPMWGEEAICRNAQMGKQL